MGLTCPCVTAVLMMTLFRVGPYPVRCFYLGKLSPDPFLPLRTGKLQFLGAAGRLAAATRWGS